MSRSRKSQRAKREEALLMRREDGTLDVTPHVAILNIITKGKYLRLGGGFIVRREKTFIKEVRA